MDMQIHTSTPIVIDKLIPPPPRRLWGEDSATEQLYRNKWEKYRNSIGEKEPSWSGLDAPCYVDFEDIPDVGDSYFDRAGEEKFATPQKTLNKPLPGSEENNNILDLFRTCSLSTIKKPEPKKTDDETAKSRQIDGVANLLSYDSNASSECLSPTLKNNVDEMDTEVPKAPDLPALDNSAEKQRLGKSRFEKKNQSGDRHCTIIEPFSFEEREKCRQEHKQARRERDSAGKEIMKGFRANPVPNFIKLRQKKIESVRPQTLQKKPGKSEMHRLQNAAEIWKKRAFQPSLPKKVTVQPKAPDLMTEIRARERQRFQEQLREKERQREALRRMEEAARKKREEEEIAKLRRELVHKAQPIRHYKTVVPKAEKRPLTEPMTPITCKRRRKL